MKTHYDVLNLDRNCTAKEIKDSFIKLSKKFHPDLNKDADAHKRFIEIREAYSVLGNSSLRHNYDQSLAVSRPGCRTTYSTQMRTPYEHYADMYTRQRSRYYSDPAGIHMSIRKLKMVFVCCLIMVFGSGLQIYAETRRRAIRTQEIARMLKESRERIRKVGAEQRLNEVIEEMRKK